MTVLELYEKMDLKLLAGEGGLGKEILDVYTGDLLSWVMSKAKNSDVWVTVMGNINVAAVAVLTEVACVILAEGSIADEAFIKRANSEDLPVFSSKEPAAKLVIKIEKMFH